MHCWVYLRTSSQPSVNVRYFWLCYRSLVVWHLWQVNLSLGFVRYKSLRINLWVPIFYSIKLLGALNRWPLRKHSLRYLRDARLWLDCRWTWLNLWGSCQRLCKQNSWKQWRLHFLRWSIITNNWYLRCKSWCFLEFWWWLNHIKWGSSRHRILCWNYIHRHTHCSSPCQIDWFPINLV